MVAVNSQMLPLGTTAPNFRLPDTDGRQVALDQAKPAKAYLIAFISNHCPYVKHIAHELAALAREYASRGVATFAISSNDVERYPADSVEKMGEEKHLRGYEFPYLYDEDQSVAKAYQAACTPDFYLFDADKKLVYRGQLDGSRPGNDIPVTGKDMREALDAVLSGRPVLEEQVPSIGCNIKWKPGNEPAWFG